MALASAADRHRGVAVSFDVTCFVTGHLWFRFSPRLGEGWVGIARRRVGRPGRVVIWGVGLARCYVTFEMYFVTVEWGEG